ncbi:MAG: leucyl aminopeptidase family protein [Tepidisphaerales bacterium]
METSTRLRVEPVERMPSDAAVVVLFAADEPPRLLSPADDLAPELLGAAQLALSAPGSPGKSDTLSAVLHQSGKTRAVHVVCLGPSSKLDADALRAAGAAVTRMAYSRKLTDVFVVPPRLGKAVRGHVAALLAEGALLAGFEFTRTTGKRKSAELAKRKPVVLRVLCDADGRGELQTRSAVALSTNIARTIASRPGNDINPVSLVDVARTLARESRLKCTVLDDRKLRQLGMGGLLGVGGGSPTPPRLIALEYRSPKAPRGARPLLVVGKTITFDTGGISIKPAERMGRMIYDKCGGMAVLGLMHALARLRPAVHVVGLLAAAENHVSGHSYRPGDVLTMYNGYTVEVTNTDAEGRLVLADAIAWGIDTYKPAAVVDLATLTGGVVVALGTTMAGLFSNSDALAAEIASAAADAGEKLWRLPVGDDQRDMLKSDLADVVNSAGRYASPLTAAAFLSLFVPDDGSVPWAHLDIAGVAETDKVLPYLGKGATGYGVRTLVNWVLSRAGSGSPAATPPTSPPSRPAARR